MFKKHRDGATDVYARDDAPARLERLASTVSIVHADAPSPVPRPPKPRADRAFTTFYPFSANSSKNSSVS